MVVPPLRMSRSISPHGYHTRRCARVGGTRSAVARAVHADAGSVRRRIGRRIAPIPMAIAPPEHSPPDEDVGDRGLLNGSFDCDRSSPRASDRRAIRTGITWVRRQPGDPGLRTTTRSNACRSAPLHCADGFRRRVGRSTSSNDRTRRRRNRIGRPVGAFDATARTCARRARIERFTGSWLLTKRVAEIDRDFAIVLRDRIQSNLCVPPQDSVEISTGIASPWVFHGTCNVTT